MNTVTAYAERARTARTAARQILTDGAPFTRREDVRASRLADYARRCEALAHAADGDRITEAFRNAGEYADDARGCWSLIRSIRNQEYRERNAR